VNVKDTWKSFHRSGKVISDAVSTSDSEVNTAAWSPVEVAIETLCYCLHEKQEVRRRLNRPDGEFSTQTISKTCCRMGG